MSNHFSADNLKFPGDDRRLDLTDVFMFSSPDEPDTTVLIIDSNPTSAPPPIPAPVREKSNGEAAPAGAANTAAASMQPIATTTVADSARSRLYLFIMLPLLTSSQRLTTGPAPVSHHRATAAR